MSKSKTIYVVNFKGRHEPVGSIESYTVLRECLEDVLKIKISNAELVKERPNGTLIYSIAYTTEKDPETELGGVAYCAPIIFYHT